MCSHCEILHDASAHRDSKPARKAKARKVVKTSGTHQTYIDAIYKTALKLAPGLTKEDRTKLSAIKLAYGAGPDGTRGVTYYNRWKRPDGKSAIPLVAVCATGQESHVQVCGTTLHELAHVIAGWEAGHGHGWIEACTKLGLCNMKAGGTDYSWKDNFVEKMAAALQALPLPADGAPVSTIGAAVGALLGPWGRPLLGGAVSIKPCGAGFGTRGGKSRGAGSGSRYLKYVCKCTERNSIRCAGTELDATCNKCKSKYVLDGESVPPAHKPAAPKPAKAKKDVPTLDQLCALVRWADFAGRQWKQQLRQAWESGNYSAYPFLTAADRALLQQLRNDLGPTWLAKYKLPLAKYKLPKKGQ